MRFFRRCRTAMVCAAAAGTLVGCHSRTVDRELVNFQIPRDAARFSISTTTDSTVVFRPIEARWLKPGMHGLTVDPSQRDALIARLTIKNVDTSGVLASIDGRVAQVTTSHVVLIVKPALAWWRDKRFWFGAGAGAAAGALAAGATR